MFPPSSSSSSPSPLSTSSSSTSHSFRQKTKWIRLVYLKWRNVLFHQQDKRVIAGVLGITLITFLILSFCYYSSVVKYLSSPSPSSPSISSSELSFPSLSSLTSPSPLLSPPCPSCPSCPTCESTVCPPLPPPCPVVTESLPPPSPPSPPSTDTSTSNMQNDKNKISPPSNVLNPYLHSWSVFNSTLHASPPSSLIQLFRNSRVDWHTLVSFPKSLDSSNGNSNYHWQVQQEKKILSFFLNPNGYNQWEWGNHYGDETFFHDYAGCNLFPQDLCLIHSGDNNKENCLKNSHCGFCEENSLCTQFIAESNSFNPIENPHHRPMCKSKLLRGVDFGIHNINDCKSKKWRLIREGKPSGNVDESNVAAQCTFVHPEPTIFTSINNDSGAMFYHFITEFFKQLVGTTQAVMGNNKEFIEKINKWTIGKSAYNTSSDPSSSPPSPSSPSSSSSSASRLPFHFIIENGDISLFNQFFGLVSQYCPRILSDNLHFPLDQSTHCYCEADTNRHVDSADHSNPLMSLPIEQFILHQLSLQHVHPSTTRPRMGIISRQLKRFLVNEAEMCAVAALEFDIECVLLPLEQMTIYEQMREFKQLHFLVAIHGSGVTNGMFISPTSDSPWRGYILHISPFNVFSAQQFFRSFAPQGTIFRDYTNPIIANSVFHWHFLNSAEYKNRQDIIRRGSQTRGSEWVFLYNSDTKVEMSEWRLMIKDMLEGKEGRNSPFYEKQMKESLKNIDKYI